MKIIKQKSLYFRIAFLFLAAAFLFAAYAENASVPDTAIKQPAGKLRLTGENIVHIVKPAESLFKIARGYGVSYPAIARANGIENPNVIFPGQELIIPLKVIIPRDIENGLLINLPEYRMYVFNNRILTGIYPVCIGLPTWQTPSGEFSVINKVEDPAWYMPPEIAERENVKREIIPPSTNNPLGDRWIGTSIKHTGIHGTNIPMSIGKALSHGCIRLYPEDIQKVFEEIKVGDSGIFLYEPVKVYVDGEEVLIEVHPDVYSLVPDIEKLAVEILKEKNLFHKIHEVKMLEALQKASGMPVPIGK